MRVPERLAYVNDGDLELWIIHDHGGQSVVFSKGQRPDRYEMDREQDHFEWPFARLTLADDSGAAPDALASSTRPQP